MNDEIKLQLNKLFHKYATIGAVSGNEYLTITNFNFLISDESFPLGAVVKPANGGLWLELDDYVPIDIDKVKRERDKIYNIPNQGWQQIEPDLGVINDTTNPYTLRHYLLNHLPVCVIKILDDSRLSV